MKEAARLLNFEESSITMPSGNVDILIGTDCCPLLPNKIKEVDNLQLLHGPFGYCIRGSHPCLKKGSSPINSCSVVVNCAFGKVHHTEPDVSISVSLKTLMDRFLETDSLGTNCNPKCGNCQCGQCATGNKNISIQEEHEMNLIEKGLEYNATKQEWTVSYPWIMSPTNLHNNFKSAMARLISTEKKLKRKGIDYTNQYIQQIEDMIKCGLPEYCIPMNYRAIKAQYTMFHTMKYSNRNLNPPQ